MTDTGGMELLEREPSLALLADCAAEARRGDGRLVILGGRPASARPPGSNGSSGSFVMPAGPGARATACSPRARSGRCTTSLEPLPAGIELAQAYANLAARRMMAARHEEAIETARRARSIAATQSAPDVISDARDTEAVSAFYPGRDWAGLMERALRIALGQDLHAAAGRAYCNFYSLQCHQRRFAEAEWVYADGIVYCDERDITTYATFLRSERTKMLEQTGRWDEALALSQEILDMPALAPATRGCPLNRTGTILARRGDPAAWEHLDEAMTLAEGTGEPLQIAPVRLTRAEAYWLEGRTAEAAREADSLMRCPIRATPGWPARWRPGCGS